MAKGQGNAVDTTISNSTGANVQQPIASTSQIPQNATQSTPVEKSFNNKITFGKSDQESTYNAKLEYSSAKPVGDGSHSNDITYTGDSFKSNYNLDFKY